MTVAMFVCGVLAFMCIGIGILGVQSLEKYFKHGEFGELFAGVAFCLLANGCATLVIVLCVNIWFNH